MGNEKIITLENLGVFKTLIETKMSENLGETDKTAFSISANSWNALAESRGGLNYSANTTFESTDISAVKISGGYWNVDERRIEI